MITADCASQAPAHCADDARRELVRSSGTLGGVDYVEVYPDGVTLCVHLFGRKPENLAAGNVVVEGGDRIRGIRVLSLEEEQHDDGDTCLRITVDKTGDFSTYCLCLVAAPDHDVRCSYDPLPEAPLERAVPAGIDPRYACASFRFRLECPALLDCKPAGCAAPVPSQPPAIDYLARDFTGFRKLLLDRLAITMPQWTERHVPDLGITMVELIAFIGDRLSYELDAIATEAYLGTARRRISVRRHARLLDYRMHDGCNARTLVTLDVEGGDLEDVALADLVFAVPPSTDLPRPRGLLAWADLASIAGTIIFEAIDCGVNGMATFRAAHSTIHFYTWGGRQCCLPEGSTRATLLDRAPDARPGVAVRARQPFLELQAGDLLVFEEIRGAQTGREADADRSKRCAVRLTRVEPANDPLDGTPLLEIEWDRDDALPFALCLSARTLPQAATAVVVAKGGSVSVQVLADGGGAARPVVSIDAQPAHGKAAVTPAGLVTYAPEADFSGSDSVILLLTNRDGSTEQVLSFEVGDAPFCVDVEVAVARGNVVLVDHGLTVSESDDRWVVGSETIAGCCRCDGTAVDVSTDMRPLTITLSRSNVTRAVLDCCTPTPASALCNQSPGDAVASIALDMAPADPVAAITYPFPATYDWSAVFDLLSSRSTDRHFVAEMDDEGFAQLRFGDNECGFAPPAGSRFRARYRVGSGTIGNVGAEAIAWVALRSRSVDGISVKPRNPMAAVGGTDPESLEHVRRHAPNAYGRVLERAVTAADYATIAARDGRVQGANADLAWTGIAFDACVALDAYARDADDASLAGDALERLAHARRVGNDVRIVPARRVPLSIALDLCIDRAYAASDVTRAVLDILSNRALPDGSLGLFHPDRLRFGEDVAASRIVAAVQAVDGILHVEVTQFCRAGDAPGPAQASLVEGTVRVAADEIVQLDNTPDFPERGTLTLNVAGGR